MHRFLFVFVATVAATISSPSVIAQDLMPPHVATRLGLTQAWMRPINAPFGAQSIADQQLYVHQVDPHEYVEIVSVVDPVEPENKVDAKATLADAHHDHSAVKVYGRINIRRVGKETIEAGRAEAMRLASNEVRRLKRRGIEAKLETRLVPRVHLYSIATNGMLESRDAESGRILWTVRVGDIRLPYRAIGVDDRYLSIINGSTLIQVDVNTGVELEVLHTRGTPMFGAINVGDFAMIPMIGGSVEGYPLHDPTRDPFLRSTSGSALAMPTKSPDSSLVAWGTDQGFVFVAESRGSPSVLFRLNTDGIVSGRIAAASGDRFFFGSEAGQVYGLRATREGEVLWSQPFGEPFYNEPAVVGNQVLISSVYGNLVSFNAETGLPTWDRPVPSISKLIGAFDDRLFVTTLSGALGVIDVSSGRSVGVFSEVHPDRLLINKQTNRLYLVSDRGEVQCLRPIDAELPTFTSQPDIEPEQSQDEKTKKPDAASPFDAGQDEPMEDGDDDPFGGDADDPFGGDDADPFGGADPFGE